MQHGGDHMVGTNDYAIAGVASAAQLLCQFLDGVVQLIRIIFEAALPGAQGCHGQKDQCKDNDEVGE